MRFVRIDAWIHNRYLLHRIFSNTKIATIYHKLRDG